MILLPKAYRIRRARAFCLIVYGLILAGCTEELNTRYGEMTGSGQASVNGTAVFAEMLRQAGHVVAPAYRLTPRVYRRAEVIVWVPDSFQPPNDEARDWFEDWLSEPDGRTLVIVGRDFDAAICYWSKIVSTLPAKSPEAREMQIDLATARVKLATRRQQAAKQQAGRTAQFDDYPDWFTSDFTGQPHILANSQGPVVTQLQSAAGWLDQIDPAKLEIELNTRLEPAVDAEVLLATAQGDSLVSSFDWGAGRILLVANGSFLLNMPLVNHEHRKLAHRLIAELGDEPREVMFLESDEAGPTVSEHDQFARSGLEILSIPPFDWILLHLAIVGVFFIVGRWPLWGLPRSEHDDSSGDFGRHIAALGRLLQQTGNRDYAQRRVEHYQQLPLTESSGAQRRRRGTTR